MTRSCFGSGRVRVLLMGVALGALALSGIAGSTGATGRSASSSAASRASTEKTIAYIEPSFVSSYWVYDAWGVEHAAAADGYKVRVFDDGSSAEQQASNGKLAVSAGVSGIIISPVDSKSDVTVLNYAAAAHIPVVVDFIGADSGRYATYVDSQNLQEGVADGQALCGLVGKGSQVIIQSLPLTRSNAVNKNNGFRSSAAKCGLKIVDDTQGPTQSIPEAESDIAAMLAAHPDVTGIFGMYDNAGLGAVAALKHEGKIPGKDVKIIAVDGSPQSIADMLAGEINGISVQQASGGGEACVKYLVEAMQGKPTPHTVLLPEPLVTLSNYASYASWLPTHIWEPGSHVIHVGKYTVSYGG